MLNVALTNSGYMYVYVCIYIYIYIYIIFRYCIYIYIYNIERLDLLTDEMERMWTKNTVEFSHRSHRKVSQVTPYLDRLEAGTYHI